MHRASNSKRDENRSAVLGRSSIMRRSLVVQDSRNRTNLLDEVHVDTDLKRSLPRPDSIVLPPSYSRILQQSSQHEVERKSHQSLESAKQRQGSSILNTSDHHDYNSQLRFEQHN